MLKLSSQTISNILVHIESKSTQDVRARLPVARGITNQVIDIWKSTEIGLKLKMQLVKSLVFSVALYGSESWAIKKTGEKKLNSFEMWVWRRTLRIS